MLIKIEDKDLGTVSIRINPRAKRYSLKVSDGAISGTIPSGGNEKTMIEFIETNRQKLILALQKNITKKPVLDPTYALVTNTFKVNIFSTGRTNFYTNLKDGVLYIACPDKTDFNESKVQMLLKSAIEKTLRSEAKRVLPRRIRLLAAKYDFKYKTIKINNSKSRWGSCSSNGNINLSLSLMLLPDHLIDYVLLHELCHTIELNHSDRFWNLLNTVTDNKALSLRKELKGYKML